MQFTHPELFLLLLLVPVLLVGAILKAHARGRAWQSLVGKRLRPFLVHSGPHARRWTAFALGLLAFAFLVATVTIPHAGFRDQAEIVRGRNVLLAIDVSRSMLARDESPDRLTAARTVALDLLATFPSDRVGLIAFSGSPWLQAPLTIDHRALTETLQQLDSDTVPRGGSDLSAAVELAMETFKKTGQSDNALIILSDGEAHDGDTSNAADLAADAGIRIFSIGFGSDEGTFIEDPSRPGERLRDRNGDLIFTRLKTDQLRTLANRTGGFYMEGKGKYLAGNLQKAVEKLDQFEAEGGQRRIPIHRYQWFLLPGIFFLICALLVNTAWRLLWRPAAALLLLGVLTPPIEARILPATAAERALLEGNYAKSRELFAEEASRARGERRARLKLGEGAASYRAGHYDGALESYSEALLSRDPVVQTEASFALGNSIYQRSLKGLQGGEASPEALDKAIASLNESLTHYDHTLSLNKEHQQARENSAHVRKVIEMLEQKKEEQEQQQQQEQDQQQDQNQESQPQDGEEGEDQQDSSQDQSPSEGEENKPPEEENPQEGEENPEDGKGEQNQEQDNQGQSPNDQPPPRDEQESEAEQSQAQQATEQDEATPEETARQILADNADFQTTPLAQRHLKQPRTKKDW